MLMDACYHTYDRINMDAVFSLVLNRDNTVCIRKEADLWEGDIFLVSLPNKVADLSPVLCALKNPFVVERLKSLRALNDVEREKVIKSEIDPLLQEAVSFCPQFVNVDKYFEYERKIDEVLSSVDMDNKKREHIHDLAVYLSNQEVLIAKGKERYLDILDAYTYIEGELKRRLY